MLQNYRSSRLRLCQQNYRQRRFLLDGANSVRDVVRGKNGHVVCGPDRHTALAGRRVAPSRTPLLEAGGNYYTSLISVRLSGSPRKVDKGVAAQRVFSVDIDDEPYFPAFFLVEQIRRKDLAKVVRTLGDLTGWNKWNFFTTPNDSLDGLTPLQALFYDDTKQVLRAAAEFAEQ